jgi:hypothetical protein
MKRLYVHVVQASLVVHNGGISLPFCAIRVCESVRLL